MSEEMNSIAVMEKPASPPEQRVVLPYEKTGEYFVERLGDIPKKPVYDAIKRLFDILFSLIVLIIVAADSRDLNYDKFLVKGEVHTMADEAYTSHNTNRLDVDGVVDKLLTTDYVKNELNGARHD